jgi:protein-tyrosine phosphatase
MVRDGSLDQLKGLLGEGKAEHRVITVYRGIIRERTADHRRVLSALAEDSVPALMHCSAGKDRAGLSIAVTLLALGVAREAIVTDYLESNVKHRRYKVRRSGKPSEAMTPKVMELLSPLFDARTEYLAAAFDEMGRVWGDIERYLAEGLAVTPELRGRLREKLLD